MLAGTGCADRESPSLGGHDSEIRGDENDDAGEPTDNEDAGSTTDDHDAGTPGAEDAGPKASDAGPAPVCASSFGSDMTTSFGRLDGTLVGVVRPQDKSCAKVNATHVVLEVRVNGDVYAIMVNVQSDDGSSTYLATEDMPLPGEEFDEGWHTTETLGYTSDLGLHSNDFTAVPITQLVDDIVSELVIGDTISVYATGYGPDGAHDVHKEYGQTHDGAIVVRPMSTSPRVLAFRFGDTDTF